MVRRDGIEPPTSNTISLRLAGALPMSYLRMAPLAGFEPATSLVVKLGARPIELQRKNEKTAQAMLRAMARTVRD